ncbi:hypothetical protein EV715DRAFT_292556 [Schizophyllum commune]
MAARERADLERKAQYIHAMHDEDGTRIIVTMFADGAEMLLRADTSYNDNTYKRTAGDWKEWEVVVWNAQLERRVTVARIYCTHETREAFAKMWKCLWDTAERLTGERVKFHFFRRAAAIHIPGLRLDSVGPSFVRYLRMVTPGLSFAGQVARKPQRKQFRSGSCR